MTQVERETMELLCEQIQSEKDPEKLISLVQELNNLLAASERPVTPAKSA